MREDDEEFGRYVPLLRRIIILVAVITAVPVILWTITAFVRAYVAPTQLPTFHQLAASATSKMEMRKSGGEQQPPAVPASKPPEPPATPDIKSGDNQAAAKGDRAAESDTAPPAPAPIKVASAPAAVPMNPKGAEVFPPPQPVAPGSNDGAAPSTMMISVTSPPAPMQPAPLQALPAAAAPTPTLAAMPAADASDASDALPAGQPLNGPIPLPRHRPRDLGVERIADMSPANVPVPRARPAAAGAGAPADDSGSSPLGFIQNLFH